VAACTLVAIEAAWRWLRRLAPSPLTERLEQILLIALVVSSAGGLGVLVGGGQPHQQLHYLYAAIALAVIPIASFGTRGRTPRLRAGVSAVAAIVALIVIARLFQTG